MKVVSEWIILCTPLVISRKEELIFLPLDGLGTSYLLSKVKAALRYEGSGQGLGDSYHVFSFLWSRLESSREQACCSLSGVI